jgi:capsid portal protein
MRGPENFNRIGLFEALPDMQGLDDKGTVKIELKNMMDYRASDFMFSDYLKNTAAIIQSAFRLPSLYLGSLESASYASSYTMIKMTESNVFVPEREMFDEQINKRLMWGSNGLGCPLWKYVSQGPQMVATEELRLSLKEFINAGALTINNSVDICNRIFGMTISKYKEEWADVPVAILKLMTNKGSFVIPDLVNADPMVGADGKNIPKGGGKTLPKDSGKPVTSGSLGKKPPIDSPNPRGHS